jgi:O-methyltransferase domain
VEAAPWPRGERDWPGPTCRTRRLPRNRQAIPSHGRLLSIHPLAPRAGPYSRKDVAILTMDMGMLVGGRGRERTEDQIRDLCRKAGFSVSRVIPTRSLLSIVEGVPV